MSAYMCVDNMAAYDYELLSVLNVNHNAISARLRFIEIGRRSSRLPLYDRKHK